MSRRYFSSTYVPTTITSGINATDVSITVAASSGVPALLPWTGVLERGTSNEDLVTVTAVSGTTYTIARGIDGQSGKSHLAGASFDHVVSARDFDEPNAHVNDTTLDQHTQYGLMKKGLAALRGAIAHRSMQLHLSTDTSILGVDDGSSWVDFQSKASADAAYAPLSGSTNYVSPTLVDAKGDLLVGTADNTLARKAVGSDGQVLTADAASAGGVKWAAAVSATSTYNPAFLGHVAALAVSGTPGGVGTANLAEYVRIRPLANVSITTIRAYIGSGLTAEVGIYSSTGTGSAARPNAKLVSATTPSGSGGWLDATVSSTALTAGTDYWLGITSSSVNGYFAVTPSVMDTNEVCKEAGASSLPATATGASPISVPLIKVLV